MVKLIASGCFIVTSVLTMADDGWVGNGGTPGLMKGKHPTIRMADETVRIYVGKKYTTVECIFHFVNEGPATSVKMGFPDYDELRDEDVDKPTSVFKKYNSWVDGKAIKCQFEGVKYGEYWQTKTVAFAANQRRTVRDRYTVLTGTGAETGRVYMRYADYILETGNTWHGPIGKATIEVEFDPDFLRPLKVVPSDSLDEKVRPKNGYIDEAFADKADSIVLRNRRTIFYSGPGKPVLRSGKLTIELKNLLPTKKDNFALKFAPYRPAMERS